MKSCPQFESCSAPICPLDRERYLRGYIDGEAVCLYMREWVKEGGPDKISRAIGPKRTELVAEACQDALTSHGPLKKRLKRCSQTASRLKG